MTFRQLAYSSPSYFKLMLTNLTGCMRYGNCSEVPKFTLNQQPTFRPPPLTIRASCRRWDNETGVQCPCRALRFAIPLRSPMTATAATPSYPQLRRRWFQDSDSDTQRSVQVRRSLITVTKRGSVYVLISGERGVEVVGRGECGC